MVVNVGAIVATAGARGRQWDSWLQVFESLLGRRWSRTTMTSGEEQMSVEGDEKEAKERNNDGDNNARRKNRKGATTVVQLSGDGVFDMRASERGTLQLWTRLSIVEPLGLEFSFIFFLFLICNPFLYF